MKNWINRVLNLLLYLSLCFMVGTGLMMWFVLPPGQGRAQGGRHGAALPTVLGLDRHDWGRWHFYVALSFAVLIVMHLWMNWTWLMKIAGGRHRWRVWVGLVVGATIILFFILAPVQ